MIFKTLKFRKLNNLVMKILHIHDTAGVSCILSKYLEKQNLESNVILKGKNDRFGIRKYYSSLVTFVDRHDFFDHCLNEGRKADIIHVHSYEEVLINLRKKLGHSKKIFLHYHGTDIRKSQYLNKSNVNTGLYSIKQFVLGLRTKMRLARFGYFNNLHFIAQKLATKTLVSTPDLLPLVKNGIYLPNPIDLEHFSTEPCNKPILDEALIINNEATNVEKSLEFCKRNNINFKISVHNRINQPIMYVGMPNFLKQFKIYIDIKFVGNNLIPAMSMTGLESLACGLKVLDHDLKIQEKFPKIHDPNKVVKNLLDIYLANK